jgi:ribosomal protein L32
MADPRKIVECNNCRSVFYYKMSNPRCPACGQQSHEHNDIMPYLEETDMEYFIRVVGYYTYDHTRDEFRRVTVAQKYTDALSYCALCQEFRPGAHRDCATCVSYNNIGKEVYTPIALYFDELQIGEQYEKVKSEAQWTGVSYKNYRDLIFVDVTKNLLREAYIPSSTRLPAAPTWSQIVSRVIRRKDG